jgi:hypothetical protein
MSAFAGPLILNNVLGMYAEVKGEEDHESE